MKKPAQKQITACQVLLTIHRRLVMIVQIKFQIFLQMEQGH